MNDREQIINFLLQSGDSKDRVIADLRSQVALLQKQLSESPVSTEQTEPVKA